MAPRGAVLLVSLLLLGSAVACKKAPTAESTFGPPDSGMADVETVASAVTAQPNGDLQKSLVGRWIEVRDWSGHAIRPELANVHELSADGMYVESLGTYRDEHVWRLTGITGNKATFHKESTPDSGMKMAAEPRPIVLLPDGAIEFPSAGSTTPPRWVRQNEPPPPVKTSTEMAKFMAILDGKPGSGARAVKQFGSPTAADALRDLGESDYVAVRAVEATHEGGQDCYLLLAGESFMNICWKGGKVVSATRVERW